ncbi:GntR family transcriptional regulator [Halobacillus halophilus]|uniref:GntR family transcription regulator n=1 Tax=Halobacillus halophilus (strain ATCC 35676 / DSM 2266 / JCM 20832 / KCTC 3685 / LMG 17431 / NBRC 102448 / NCIMB 2269) TaxID=866895 RepID=I0JIU9_HALH3|nr:GntR family transcriptional regulator [Halobacillus halophilus]CCG44067.1 GntR family transcription regulator [Halobacillus halophilus DSM 2266]
MILNTDGTKPIYLQIAEWIENEILNGDLPEDEKVYSQYKLADMYNINPATAAKGLTKLAEEGILYDKRGIGKFVSSEAIKIIKDKRINHTLKSMVEDLIQEAERLDMAETELISLIKETRSRNKGG